jgi:NAD(P)-dependent dehydrogenase (short-subunit alcohol dehydrogenase family)
VVKFDKQIAIVTGAGGGIGACIASRFARNGASVILVGSTETSLVKVADSIRSASGECIVMTANVSQKSQVQKVVDEVLNRYGRIDILVNNAGITRDNFISKITEVDWDDVLNVNLKGAFLFCQAVFPSMKEKLYGKVINITSRSWLGTAGQANYSSSKGGLVSLTRTLALEFARYQLNVNAVAPGPIETPMTQKMSSAAREQLLKMQPTGKIGSVNDVAAAVEFLASAEASFITGQTLHVDGGKSCGINAF